MKVIAALIFGALAQGQTTSSVTPLAQRQAAPATSSVLPKSATLMPITPPRASTSTTSDGTALKDRQFFVANPIMDAMLVSTLAPKSTSSDAVSTSASTSSSSGLTNTLLVASLLGSGNQQQQQRPRSRYSQPQYQQPQYGQPQYGQQSFQQQPQYFAPPQRSYQDGYGYDSHYGSQQREDPLKKMVLLSGVVSGSMNPLAAVAMDNNKQMSSTDALVMSSLGNNPLSTMLAVGGGGSGSGSGSSSNMLTTLAVASAFSPKSSSSSSSGSSALGTLATLSLLNQNSNQNGGSSSGSSGGLFSGLFGN